MPSKTLQWYTAVSVTKPKEFVLNHFQKRTSSFIVADWSLVFCAKSNTWSVRWLALRAITCLFQCMMALSALIGRRMISLLCLRLIIMTSGLASSLSFCRTHMKLSDSKV